MSCIFFLFLFFMVDVVYLIDILGLVFLNVLVLKLFLFLLDMVLNFFVLWCDFSLLLNCRLFYLLFLGFLLFVYDFWKSSFGL